MNKYEKRVIFLKVIMFALMVGILVICGMLVNYGLEYKNDRQKYDAIRQIAYQKVSESDLSDSEAASKTAFKTALNTENQNGDKEEDISSLLPQSPIDFEALKEINPDTVGWIYACDGDIDGPVVQTDDNSYYLSHRFDKSNGSVGTFFADSLCAPAFEKRLTVIYGHNRKDGSMFHPILNYKDKNYFNRYPEFEIHTEEGIRTYRIFSAYFADNDEIYDDTFYDAIEKGTDDALIELYTEAAKRSLYETKTPSEITDIVILSTCEYSNDDNRMVVYGVYSRP